MKRYFNSRKLVLMLVAGGMVAYLSGGCGLIVTPTGLSGNWGLQTISVSGLPSTALIYNNATGQVQQVVFRIDGVDVTPTILSTSTIVNGTNVLVAVYMGSSTLLFGGTFDSGHTIATGTLTGVVNQGTLIVSIPNLPAQLQLLLTQ
jgi:hypothetical protein